LIDRRFPRRTLRGDKTLYRIHRDRLEPWWFSTSGFGRFDPAPPSAGVGCCYLAEDPLGAWVEVFRTPTLIAEADVTSRRILTTPMGRDLRLADLTSRRALGYGITATLGAGEDYAPSQAFAAEAHQAGFDGVRYLVRHDPAQKLYGVALFGPAGAADLGDPDWPSAPDEAIGDDLIDDARQRFGYRVLPSP
jgi:hypothetical protein